jgi:hypothetical protein
MVAEEEHIEMVEGETNYPVRLCSIDTVPAFHPSFLVTSSCKFSSFLAISDLNRTLLPW